jgi:hypothetical protein
MAPACEFNAPNGQPSLLYRRLVHHVGETMAASLWEKVRTPAWQNEHGEWLENRSLSATELAKEDFKQMVFGFDEKRKYEEVKKHWKTNGNQVVYSRQDRDVTVKSLERIWGKERVSSYEFQPSKFRVSVKGPKLSKDLSSLDLNYNENFDTWWNELSEDNKLSETMLAVQNNIQYAVGTQDPMIKEKYFSSLETMPQKMVEAEMKRIK